MEIGDIVRFLNTTGGGKVTRIEGQLAYVEDEDGFETPTLIRECVVVAAAPKEPTSKFEDFNSKPKTPDAPPSKYKAPAPETVRKSDELAPVEETPEGEKLTVMLAYEPRDIRQLQTTTYDAYLVNDSNYYLLFTYMTRSDDSHWTIRYAGRIEPGIQLYLGEVKREDLADMDRVAIQYVAYKEDKEFRLKSPGAMEARLDTTKFCRLHCFRENEYFTTPVIAVTVVKNDVIYKPLAVDAVSLETELKAKKRIDIPARRPLQKNTAGKSRPATSKNPNEPLVVDLHITELLDDLRGLSNADMLNCQIDEFRKVMDENLSNHGKKIVFIHGKGEGVLRQALMKELNYRYKKQKVQDASFKEYGYGATQVTIV